MPEEEEIAVDARGRRCPIPTLKLRRALERGPPGAIVRLIADDPMVRIDIRHFAAQAGVEIVSLEEVGGVISVRARIAPWNGMRRAVGGNGAPPG